MIVSEFHFAEFVRQITARGFVFLPGQFLSLRRYIIQAECPQLARAEQAQQSRARYQGASQPFGSHFWCITGTNNHEQPSPKTDQKTNGQIKYLHGNGTEKPFLRTTLAKLASIVPTPMGQNDSPNGPGQVST
ncbi:hypothetical protein EMIT043CA1_20210 [Pseudomonas brassicacearum]